MKMFPADGARAATVPIRGWWVVQMGEEEINYKKRLVLIYCKRKQLGILVFVCLDFIEIFQPSDWDRVRRRRRW